jgi:hypothetical protein
VSVEVDAKPDLAAHEEVLRLNLPQVARKLTDLLGGRLVAYVGGVKETRAVRQWIEGDRQPQGDTEARLREALIVAIMLSKKEKVGTIQAWFQGLNPLLDDRSPARLLRDGDLAKIGPEVRSAARAFLIAG